MHKERKRGVTMVQKRTSKRLKRAINDVKLFIKKYIELICQIFPELLLMRSYKYVVQSVFHKKLFVLLTPTLFDLYQVCFVFLFFGFHFVSLIIAYGLFWNLYPNIAPF